MTFIGPVELEFFLRLMILRLGGSVTVEADSDEVLSCDDVALFMEQSETGRGIVFTTVRTGDEWAGHA
jgi:hypothetical protein